MAAGSDNENIVDQLEYLLSCPICLETLTDLRTLPCFHSFCRCCLQTFVEKQREKADGKEIEDFYCPTCRSVFSVKRNESVDAMSGSHFIRNMLEVVAIQRQTKVAKCSRCEEPSTCRCVDCELFMCEKCLGVHQSWHGVENHSILSMNELSQPENQAKMKARLHCGKHINKKLKFYCETCQELTCRFCMDFSHVRPDHLCLPIEKVAEKHKKVLKSCYDHFKEKLTEGNQALRATLHASQALKDNVEKTKDVINQDKERVRKKLMKMLDEQAQIKISEVDKLDKDIDEQFTTHINDLKSFVDKVKDSVNLSQNLLEKGNDEEIISSQKMLEERVKKIKRECPKRMEPVHDGEIHYKTMTEINLTAATLGTVVCQPAVNAYPYSILTHASIILNEKVDYAKKVAEWLNEYEFKWRLCYRASRDGWDADHFHTNCDDKGPTVTLVKVNDYIFGGFTDQSWEGDGVFKTSTSSFLFSLANKDGLPPFKAVVQNDDRAIVANKDYGPIFGAYDFFIMSQSHLNTRSHSSFGRTYQLPDGYVNGTAQANSLLAGNYHFTVSEFEVFY